MKEARWSNDQFAAVVRLISERAGLTFRETQRGIVEQEIALGQARSGCPDLRSYYDLLRSNPEVLDELLVELTIGETYFFRDPWQIELVRNEVLPDLRARRGPDATLRVWSAGCATGEEPYSLAVLFDQEGILDRTRILGTDISRRSLKRAGEGVYRRWSLRGPQVEQMLPYLQEGDGVVRLKDSIRKHVRFEYLNLALDSYPSLSTRTTDMDLIFCRNVLIYFDRQTVAEVAQRLFTCLAPGGWLIMAASDPMLDEYAPLHPVVTERGIVYRRPVDEAPPAMLFKPTSPAANSRAAERSPTPSVPRPSPEDRTTRLERARQALRRGDYATALEMTDDASDSESTFLHAQALSNVAVDAAERYCRHATSVHPFSVELFHLHAVLLIEMNRGEEAARVARSAVYLDPGLPMAHFTLGSILRRRGDLLEVRRAFRNAAELCRTLPQDETLRLADGERVGDLRQAALRQLEALDHQRGIRP